MKSRTATAFIAIVLAASSLRAATPTSAPLQVKDLLAISSKKELLDLSIDKAEALATTMSHVQDEETARAFRPEMERMYMEWVMVTTRLSMMGPPTEADVQMATATVPRYQQVRQSLQREGVRIAQSRSMMVALQSVMLPLSQQFAIDSRASAPAAVRAE